MRRARSGRRLAGDRGKGAFRRFKALLHEEHPQLLLRGTASFLDEHPDSTGRYPSQPPR